VRIVWVVSQGVKLGGCLETLECSWSSWSHSSSETSWSACVGALEGKWDNLGLWCREGGTLPWVVQVDGE
jgi:hypothetical protein